MGSCEDKIIGISADDSCKGLKSQLLNCFGTKPYYYGFGPERFEDEPSIDAKDFVLGEIDRRADPPNMEKLFSLCNKLFGITNVCYVKQGEESNYCSAWYHECVYDAANMKKYVRDLADGAVAYYDYYGHQDGLEDGLDFDDVFPDLQDQFIEYARKRNIDIDWYSFYKHVNLQIYFDVSGEVLYEIIKKLGLEEMFPKDEEYKEYYSDGVDTFLYLKYKKEAESIADSMGEDYEWELDGIYYGSDWIGEFLYDVRTAHNGSEIANIYQEIYDKMLEEKNTPTDDESDIYDRSTTDSVVFVDLDKEYVSNIMDKSIQLGYTELTALILDRFKDILGTDLDTLSLDDN